MNQKYKLVCAILNEFGNCAAGITGAYETPARPFKIVKTTIVKKDLPIKTAGPVSKRDKKKGY